MKQNLFNKEEEHMKINYEEMRKKGTTLTGYTCNIAKPGNYMPISAPFAYSMEELKKKATEELKKIDAEKVCILVTSMEYSPHTIKDYLVGSSNIKNILSLYSQEDAMTKEDAARMIMAL